ncbi:MAG TPA: serine/threonine-protein kinase [Spirillospora sp.]|nr:serine/threonine-protein kinase [Spirillospora sp.]
MPKEYAPGDVIGTNLQLIARLGTGGMGTVWRARHRHLHTDVAVKQLIIPRDVSDRERSERLERARREGRTAARLPPHPHIVGIRDLIEEEGVPWLVMNLVEGRSLTEVVQADGPLSPDRAATVGWQMADALRVMHQRDILHRDIKPDNILLTPDDGAVLVDFGIAVHAADETLTGKGLFVGTPSYLDPERLRGERVQNASDLFCLGATLYFAVEGRQPFQREHRDATFYAIRNGGPLRYERAAALGPIIDGLLVSDPASRTDADDLILQLAAFLDGGSRPQDTSTASLPRAEAPRTPTLLNEPEPEAASKAGIPRRFEGAMVGDHLRPHLLAWLATATDENLRRRVAARLHHVIEHPLLDGQFEGLNDPRLLAAIDFVLRTGISPLYSYDRPAELSTHLRDLLVDGDCAFRVSADGTKLVRAGSEKKEKTARDRRPPPPANDVAPPQRAATTSPVSVSPIDFEWLGHLAGLVALAVALVTPLLAGAGGGDIGHTSGPKVAPTIVMAVLYLTCHFGAMFYTAHLFDEDVGCGYYLGFGLVANVLVVIGYVLHGHLGFFDDWATTFVGLLAHHP